MKKIRYILEYVGFAFLYFFIWVLPLSWSSNLGGWLARLFGRLLGAHRTAHRNVMMVFGDQISAVRRRAIVQGMWEQFGRVIFEYPRFAQLIHHPECLEIEGLSVIEALYAQKKGVLLVGAHLANFQMPAVALRRFGMSVTQVSRKANNKWVDVLMNKAQKNVIAHVIFKGLQGTRQLIASLKKGCLVLILVDQKMREGKMIPFMGHLAPTADGFLKIAKKTGAAVVMVRTIRTGPLSFRVLFYPPLDLRADDETLLRTINDIMGGWILEYPEQWLWMHNRWDT